MISATDVHLTAATHTAGAEHGISLRHIEVNHKVDSPRCNHGIQGEAAPGAWPVLSVFLLLQRK